MDKPRIIITPAIKYGILFIHKRLISFLFTIPNILNEPIIIRMIPQVYHTDCIHRLFAINMHIVVKVNPKKTNYNMKII